jgi:hypothetical protein
VRSEATRLRSELPGSKNVNGAARGSPTAPACLSFGPSEAPAGLVCASQHPRKPRRKKIPRKRKPPRSGIWKPARTLPALKRNIFKSCWNTPRRREGEKCPSADGPDRSAPDNIWVWKTELTPLAAGRSRAAPQSSSSRGLPLGSEGKIKLCDRTEVARWDLMTGVAVAVVDYPWAVPRRITR